MALTPERLDELSREMVKGYKSVNWLARAIEAEARRDALEEAEKKCDQEASEWDKCSDGHVSVQSIAAAIRKLKEDIQ